VNVHRRIARIIGWRRRVSIFALKTFQTRPRLEHGPVHREVLVGHQAGLSGLVHHGVEERAGDVGHSIAIVISR
jgi:hypothetical protein